MLMISAKKFNTTILPEFALTNVNMLAAGIAVETLFRLGVNSAVIAPGSRSAPFAIALASHKGIETIPVLDERSAAFFALGLAKRNRQPIILLCSSGTAAANFYPAIVEASISNVPLIVITADRPQEMRDCRSRQTIDQVKLYAHYPRWQHELSVPELSEDYLKYLRQTLSHAVNTALWPHSGPVHINAPFKDPLEPTVDKRCQAFVKSVNFADFFNHLSPQPDYRTLISPIASQSLQTELSNFKKGIIVVGQYQCVKAEDAQAFVHAIANISKALQWPVLADAHNSLRNFSEELPLLISNYDIVLRNPEVAEELIPEAVLSVGPLPTSKVLRKWLSSQNAKTWVLEENPVNVDDLHRNATHLHLSAETFANLLSQTSNASSDYASLWRNADTEVQHLLSAKLKQTDELFEGKWAYELSQLLPENANIFISSSMPVRDFEFFWQPNNQKILTYFNRGANGIDGTLSSALGVAHGNLNPTVLVTGDLALLYDTDGFLINNHFQGHLTILLINNNGGRIFENLPVAAHDVSFEKFFATPQFISFKNICTTYNVDYQLLESWEMLEDALKTFPNKGIRLLELPTDSKRDVPHRKALLNEVSQQLNLIQNQTSDI